MKRFEPYVFLKGLAARTTFRMLSVTSPIRVEAIPNGGGGRGRTPPSTKA